MKNFPAHFYAAAPLEARPGYVLRPPNERMRLSDAVFFLKKQGFALENTQVSYYSSIFHAYINCNLDPVSKNIWLSLDELETLSGRLTLRLRFHKCLSQQFATTDPDGAEQESAYSEEAESPSSCSPQDLAARPTNHFAPTALPNHTRRACRLDGT